MHVRAWRARVPAGRWDMTYDPLNNFPVRYRPVHQPVHESGNESAIIFLTVCVAARRPSLATPEMHRFLLDSWTKANLWIVGRYVIMPDHIHMFCAPGTNPPESLRLW